MSKYCQKCGTENEDKAKKCVQCGKKFKKPWYKKVWVWILAAIVSISVVSCVASDGESSSTNTEKSSKAVTETIVETTKAVSYCHGCGKEITTGDFCDECKLKEHTSDNNTNYSEINPYGEFAVLIGMTKDEATDYLKEHYNMYSSDIEIIKEHNNEVPEGYVFDLSGNKKAMTLTISTGPDQETLVEMIKADPLVDIGYNDFIRYPSKYAGKYIIIDTNINIKRESILGIGYDVLYGTYNGSLIHFEDKREFKEPNFIDGDHLRLYCVVADEPATMKITQADYQSFGIFGGVNYNKTTDTYQIPKFYIIGAEFIE